MAEEAEGNPFFEASSPFGTLPGWEPQEGGGGNNTKQYSVVLNKEGDFLAGHDYDKRREVSCTYKANASGAVIPNAGAIKNGFHIDSITVTFSQNDFVQMTINGHAHIGGKPDSNCRQYAPTIGTVGGFGCPSSIGPFDVGEQAVGVRTITYTLQCNHVDELQGDGSHFAGDNYDGTETLAIDLTGVGTFPDDDANWHLDSDSSLPSSTGASTSSASYTRHLAHVANTGTQS